MTLYDLPQIIVIAIILQIIVFIFRFFRNKIQALCCGNVNKYKKELSDFTDLQDSMHTFLKSKDEGAGKKI